MSAQPSVPQVTPAKEWRIVKDWHWIVTKSWSIRWLALAAVLSGLEVAFTYFTDNPPLPRGVFALLSSITTIAAFAARFYAQRDNS